MKFQSALFHLTFLHSHVFGLLGTLMSWLPANSVPYYEYVLCSSSYVEGINCVVKQLC